ncbi:MAG: toxin-antitoxin system YwqK family antitoxin, partial [Thermoplasmata archaeon]
AYYENGNIHMKANYKNNKLDGEFIVYDKNGEIKEHRIYKDGKVIKMIK